MPATNCAACAWINPNLMLPDSASVQGPPTTDATPTAQPPVPDVGWLAQVVSQYMHITQQVQLNPQALHTEDDLLITRLGSSLHLSFIGHLTQDADSAYSALDADLSPQDCYALFRETQAHSDDDLFSAPHVIHIVQRRIPQPEPMKRWPALLLFVLTLLSMMWTGTQLAIGEIALQNEALATSIQNSFFANLWRGVPYALGLMLILLPHELGHYLMMRRYRVPASLPYFIPGFFISPFGTFGAAIALRTPLRNRKVLLDVGVAGPIAGLVLAIPVLLIGLATSPITPMEDGLVEGKSLMYAGAHLLTFGEMLPNGEVDVMVNQLAWAGWTGLFVTALNLIPVGQFDGGHVLYGLLGDRARRVFPSLMAFLIVLGLFASTAWLLLTLLLLLLGRAYAMPLDAITPLNPARRYIAWFVLLLFALTFVPAPLYRPGGPNGLLGGVMMQALALLPVVMLLVGRVIIAPLNGPKRPASAND